MGMRGGVAIAVAFWTAFSGAGLAEQPVALGVKKKLVEGTQQVSPPALQFDRAGSLHAAWFEKRGDARGLYTVTMRDGELAIPTPVQVNPTGLSPDAMHQSPGLATGPQGELYATWATPKAGAPFAADLRLARSPDGGNTFESPVIVNDDGASINHTFEHVAVAGTGEIYVAWLDNRNKEKSGAGALFTCSRDNGKTVENNLIIDGMACPCCRPMAAVAPDGSLWVAWRKTFDGNVRDIVVARSTDRGRTFSAPMLVRRDGWSFAACPHRGPSIGFDRQGRLYVGWYTEGTDEQPRILVATSDDQGKTFSAPVSLHSSGTSLPDQFRLTVHPEGFVAAVWEEVTGVRKRVVMRVSTDRGQTFGPVLTLSEGAKAENPTVAVHENGALAVAWTEHAWPHNRIVLQQGRFTIAQPAALR